jgi:hypothetical protein
MFSRDNFFIQKSVISFRISYVKLTLVVVVEGACVVVVVGSVRGLTVVVVEVGAYKIETCQ